MKKYLSITIVILISSITTAQKVYELDTNVPDIEIHLKYVERLYNEIGKQLKGFYYKDDGPIIGI